MHIRVVTPPAGDAPEYVRKAWVGIVLPLAPGHIGQSALLLRSKVTGRLSWILLILRGLFGLLPKESKAYIVRCETAFEMLSKTSPSAVDWWRENRPEMFTSSMQMAFPILDCEEIDDLDSTSDIGLINSEREPMRPRDATVDMRDHAERHPSFLAFDELFRGVAVWRTILFGAVAGPIMGMISVVLAMRKSPPGFKVAIFEDVYHIAASIIGLMLIGGAVGAARSMKAVKQLRYYDTGMKEPFLAALFGFGIWSVLLFWTPLMLGVTILVVSLIGI